MDDVILQHLHNEFVSRKYLSWSKLDPGFNVRGNDIYFGNQVVYQYKHSVFTLLLEQGIWINSQQEGNHFYFSSFDHSKRILIQFQNGIKNGLEIKFNPDGSVNEYTPYVNGQEHGYHISYNGRGGVYSFGKFEYGMREGPWIDWKIDHVNHCVIVQRGKYLHNQKIGKWI